MRRTTSALITTILGALLTASTVLAQQSPPSGSAPRGRSTSPDSTTATDSATTAAATPLYGMTATRGVRYLLRNGLDYLNYQQYERALKFLREAETRQKANPKELNATEMLALKQGIERAQRGLREASDAESPYARSERSRPCSGFNPAKPESSIASNTDPLNPPTRKPGTNRSPKTNLLASDGEDQGEPIRLASGETASSDTRPPQTEQNAMPRRAAAGAETSQSPVLTPAARPAVEPPDAQTPDKELVLSPVPTGETSAPNNMAATIRSPAPLATPVPSSSGLAQPSTASSAPKAAPNPTVIDLETISSPALAGSNAQPTAAGGLLHKESEDATPASMPNPSPDVLPAPPAASNPGPAVPAAANELPPAPSELSRPTMPNPAQAASPAPGAAAAPGPAAPVVANELPLLPPELSRTAISNPAQDASPAAALTPGPAAPVVANELPPLPPELSRTTIPNPAQDASPVPAAAAGPGPAVPDAADELPPLPPELGRTTTPKLTQETSPVSASTPTPGPASPDVSNALRSPAALTHTETESLPPLPGGNEAASTTTAAPGEGHNVDAGPAVILPQSPPPAASETSGPAPTSGPDLGSAPTDVDRPALPAPGVAVAAPAGQPSLATNPNLEQQPAASAATGVEAAPDPSSLPPAIENRKPSASSADSLIPDRHNSPSTLRPELQREVEIIARHQEEELHRQTQNPPQPSALPRETSVSDLRTQTQLDISRAPSPAEARPIRAIPVPEDWVALAPRTWSPQRKYWAAAATCHLPLYFQDPVLERYGHSVEQFVGPMGRFLTYPVDDPTQSTQRNQIIQPFFSAGLFALQIAALPYNLIVDPPWEAQYDLGYYRPGDNIPTDTYWLPLHGYGPPLHGSRY
ncbi:MAG: hypothetical protein ACHRXM_02745 [Isosphaerales bacterium]